MDSEWYFLEITVISKTRSAGKKDVDNADAFSQRRKKTLVYRLKVCQLYLC